MPRFQAEINFIKGLWAKAGAYKATAKETVQAARGVGKSAADTITGHEGVDALRSSAPWKLGAGAVGAAWETTKFLGKSALDPKPFRGFLNRTVLGAGVGGLYGATQADTSHYSEDLNAKSILGAMTVGALGGAAVGAGVSVAYGGIRGAGAVGKAYYKAGARGRKAMRYGAAGVGVAAAAPLAVAGGTGAAVGALGVIGAGALAWKAGKFAMRHPVGTLATGAVAAGAGSLAWNELQRPTSSPTLEGVDMEVNYAEQMNAAQMLMSDTIAPMGRAGPAPTMLGPSVGRLQASTQGLTQGLHRGRHG